MTSSKAAEVKASEAAAAAEILQNSEKRVAEATARAEAAKVAKAERAMAMSDNTKVGGRGSDASPPPPNPLRPPPAHRAAPLSFLTVT